MNKFNKNISKADFQTKNKLQKENNIVISCKYKVNLTQRNTGLYLIKSAVLILLQKSMKNNCNSIISVFIKM